jgi:hypothetical protein
LIRSRLRLDTPIFSPFLTITNVNEIYSEAIAYELEQAYYEQNKETADKEAYNKNASLKSKQK